MPVGMSYVDAKVSKAKCHHFDQVILKFIFFSFYL